MSSTSICWRFEWPWVPLIGDLGRYAENDRHHPLTLFMNTRIDIKSVLPGLGVGVLFTLGVTEDTARAVEGYEAIGHLTYTVFDNSVKPTGKRIIMFDVKVGKTWHVRTEPVIECKNGIAFQEGFSDTNNCIWSLTAFEAAYKPSDSPFQDLRSELKNSMRGDVYFTNAPPKLPGWAARSSSKATSGHPVNNAAIASVLNGKYPPMDPSYAGFLWFAFTPPSAQGDGTNQMLLEIWDEGNPHQARFRRARWTQFAESPKLVSSAVYNWVGKAFLPDGTVATIPASDVPQPLGMAARYEVESTTNLSGLMLPSKLKLTRYATVAAKDGKPRVLTTDVAVVTSVRLLSANESLAANLPGRTYVSDYRVSARGLNGKPTSYILDGGCFPP